MSLLRFFVCIIEKALKFLSAAADDGGMFRNIFATADREGDAHNPPHHVDGRHFVVFFL